MEARVGYKIRNYKDEARKKAVKNLVAEPEKQVTE